ncbi:MAG: ABC-type molybdenum transport system, ATPase component/photorepair protein PhrA [Paenibacillaceae bacterium]|nr:ABC-type molybdenum transport system, ATPase component/photorepair protein PhrA [Paenibacillaceae bacterium]
MIRMEHIRFVREQRIILDDVNLHMEQGQHWVVLGRNGSGKTTLLELATGYQFPSSGGVEVLGNRYGQVDIREVRKRIGYISQSLIERLALKDPVWEVVATGEYGFLRFYQTIDPEVIAKAEELLRTVGLYHLKDQPLGTLSQGERKKIVLARALMSDPELLIMDELCSGLDLYEREKLLQDIGGLGASPARMMVYVTHHMEEIVPVFTHVALIEAGKLLAAGPKEAVLTPQLLSQAYGLRVEIEWSHGRPWVRAV